MGRNDGTARMFSDQSISGRGQKSLLDNLSRITTGGRSVELPYPFLGFGGISS